MESPASKLQRLGTAQTKEQLISAVWDLRDSAFDRPDLWSAFTAERLFQYWAEELEEQTGHDGALTSAQVLASAMQQALQPA